MTTVYEQIGRTASLVISNTVSNNTITIKGLRVTFKIKKTPKGAGNKADIVIYNLSENSRKVIETEVDKNGDPQTAVELLAGYKGAPERVLFRGLFNATSRYKSPDWVTTLSGTDGIKQFRYLFEKTYTKGTPISTIVSDIAKQSGMTAFSVTPPLGFLKKTRTFSGPPLSIIKSLQETFPFTFDIQDEGYIIRTNKYGLDPRFIIAVDYNSGLLGEPRTKGNLVIIDTLINPDIRPNSYINLRSKGKAGLDGTYIIQRVDSAGDSYSGAWTMTIEMVRTDIQLVITA